jgi:hypothetical protein
VQAIQWGIEHERDAISTYEKATGSEVKACGLLVSPNGFLGASPDGFVGENVALEVKCPRQMRSSKFSDVVSNDKTFFIGKIDNSECDSQRFLKPDHAYYHQVQGQMYLSGRSECHFVVWSPEEAIILKVAKDDTWASKLVLMSSFHCDFVLTELIKMISNSN